MAAVFRQWARGTPGLGDTWTARTQKLLGVGTAVISSLLRLLLHNGGDVCYFLV